MGEALPLLSEWHGPTATYTTAEGVATAGIQLVTFRFFIGALDETERADVEISKAVVSNPNEGDFFVITGESFRWYIVDIRERPGYFQCSARRKKERS